MIFIYCSFNKLNFKLIPGIGQSLLPVRVGADLRHPLNPCGRVFTFSPSYWYSFSLLHLLLMNKAPLSSSLFVCTFAYLFCLEIFNNNIFKIHELEDKSKSLPCPWHLSTGPRPNGHAHCMPPWDVPTPDTCSACTRHVAQEASLVQAWPSLSTTIHICSCLIH